MIYAKCTEKFRDSSNKITGYMVADNYGHSKRFQSEDLKRLIRNGKLCITNLTLTSDGRLINTQDKPLVQSQTKNSSENVRVRPRPRMGVIARFAEAIVFINKECKYRDMGMKELTATVCKEADICTDISYYTCDTRNLIGCQVSAFMKLINTNPDYVKNFLYDRLTPINLEALSRKISVYMSIRNPKNAEKILTSLSSIREYLAMYFGESVFDITSLAHTINNFWNVNQGRVVDA